MHFSLGPRLGKKKRISGHNLHHRTTAGPVEAAQDASFQHLPFTAFAISVDVRFSETETANRGFALLARVLRDEMSLLATGTVGAGHVNFDY